MALRKKLDYLVITVKGMAMGAADVVPGVSGGTIAFITGIYEELIETIHNLDLGFFKIWKTVGFKVAWKAYNLGFILALFSGVLISIISFAKLITYLLDTFPILVWSFFFGLVLASILYVGKQIQGWNAKLVVAMSLAASAAYLITLAKPLGGPDNIWFLFLAGFVAIIAMILPGISGAFILLLLGAYKTVLGAITQLFEGLVNLKWALFSQALLKIVVFAVGAIVGLKVFSRALNWLFKHKKNLILAILTGFMIGALNKIWPWKNVISYRESHDGSQVPFIEESILPFSFDGDPQLFLAIVFVLLGFFLILFMERLASPNKTS